MTTQRKMTVAEYIAHTDEYCKGVKELLTAVGDEDTEGTMVHFAANNRATIVALAEPDEAQLTADFIDAVMTVIASIGREAAIATYFSAFNAAIRQHLGAVDLNTWLASDGTRVNSLWKRAGDPALLPVNCCPPVTILGNYAVSGSGAGTLTDGAVVDASKYGGAQIRLRVTDQQVGAADINVTVACRTAAGAAVNKTGKINSGSAENTPVALGSAADRIVDVTAVTITGGTAGDKFQIETIEDRTI